jgi:methylmalonyl-CoA/ethylmalonyl-CoA epimerase
MSLPRVDHTAIVVRDLEEALGRYGRLFGLQAVERAVVPGQGVEVAFLAMGDTQIELIEPTDAGSGVARFLESHGESLHHIGVAVDDIRAELSRLSDQGIELVDREPRQGAHGEIAFVHPRGTGGILVELVGRPRGGHERSGR